MHEQACVTDVQILRLKTSISSLQQLKSWCWWSTASLPTKLGDTMTQLANTAVLRAWGTKSTTTRKCVVLTHCLLLNGELPWEGMLPSMETQLHMLEMNLFRHQNFQNSIIFSYTHTIIALRYLVLWTISKLLVSDLFPHCEVSHSLFRRRYCVFGTYFLQNAPSWDAMCMQITC